MFARLKDELGIETLLSAPRDVHLILLTRSLRMFAYGSSTLILALHLSALKNSDTLIGIFMSLTLVGDVFISLLLTFVADSLGRRKILLVGSVTMALSGVVFATQSSFAVLLIAAVIGVISPSGNEIGPFRAVEESTLAHLIPAAQRSDIFAWYVVVGTFGTSVGALLGGWLVSGLDSQGNNTLGSYQVVFWLYALIGCVKSGITFLLSSACELEKVEQKQSSETGNQEETETFIQQPQSSSSATASKPSSKFAFTNISPSSRKTLLKLAGLFSIDSLASGMASVSLTTYFLAEKFGSPPSSLGTITAVASLMSSIGNIAASSVSKRIGFIYTMVFTHLPSAIFLAMMPAPHSLSLTVFFIVARATLASMDQAPRSAFLSAVVQPSERTAVMGTLNTVKTAAQSAGPLLTGVLAQNKHFGLAFVIAGVMKAGYDLGLLHWFAESKMRGNSADEARDRARQQEDEEGQELR
ncbi:MFS general substrate transporter [Aureobasidium pullulans]|uniref:MFS general substrate transporter n=1 Tax=Aureobasidium pullulans TaxID=5580 RepID=A0A4V4KXK7_AURPU|nr:MFS general substrate transporter [Aureobasidium pullulans]